MESRMTGVALVVSLIVVGLMMVLWLAIKSKRDAEPSPKGMTRDEVARALGYDPKASEKLDKRIEEWRENNEKVDVDSGAASAQREPVTRNDVDEHLNRILGGEGDTTRTKP